MITSKRDSEMFYLGLVSRNKELLDRVPKTDLHCHADRGANILDIMDDYGIKVSDPPVFESISEMDAWYEENIGKSVTGFDGLIRRYISLFKTAEAQNIKIFSPSFCLSRGKYFDNGVEGFIQFISQLKKCYAPHVKLYPELVLSRHDDISVIEKEFEEALKYDFFKSIDIIGDENKGIDKFIEIYREADNLGWILKAHVGEFGGVSHMEDAIEKLNLDVINHGLAACKSPNLMCYLAASGIKLNICPSSNVLLSRVKCYRDHPIGQFVRNGIICSINTDDLLIFNQTVSDEYLNLYCNQTLSLEELNKIREDGLTKFLVKRK